MQQEKKDEVRKYREARSRTQKFQIPYGLEEIIPGVIDYIMLKTNRKIDKLEKEAKLKE